MNTKNYQAFVEELWFPAPGSSIKGNEALDLAIAGLGLAGEAGEALEYVKKFCAGKHEELKTDKLFDELGDVLYYLTKILNSTGRSLDDLMLHNVYKLCDRFNLDAQEFI